MAMKAATSAAKRLAGFIRRTLYSFVIDLLTPHCQQSSGASMTRRPHSIMNRGPIKSDLAAQSVVKVTRRLRHMVNRK
jgi:hypothetical protein